MDPSSPTSNEYDDLFNGEPDQQSLSPPPHASGNRDVNSEDDAWAMFDEAVAEDEGLRPKSRSPAATQQRRGPSDAFVVEDGSVLWQSRNDSVEHSNHNRMPYSYDATTGNRRSISPSETELIEKGFEFHNQVSEQTIVRKFNNEHFRQALRDVDPSMPRKVQWRAWKAKRDEYLLLGGHDSDQSEAIDEDLDEYYEGDISLFDDEGKDLVSSRQKSSALKQKVQSTDINPPPSVDAEGVISDFAHSPIKRSKYYLSEITPSETQGHHPSIIPRSPQQKLTRVSSLASSAPLDVVGSLSEIQPLTKEALSAKDKEASVDLETYGDIPSSDRTEPLHYPPSLDRLPSPFRKPADFANSVAPEQSSILGRPVDMADAESTRAVRGSPIRPPDMSSRPDTPRPSFLGETAYRSVEQGLPISPWTKYGSPARAERSHSPSLVSVGGVDVASTSGFDSPSPVKVDPIVRSAEALPPPFQTDHTSNTAEGYQSSARPLNNHLSVPQPQFSMLSQSSTLERPTTSRGGPAAVEAWMNFTQTLQRISAAKSIVDVEPHTTRTPVHVHEASSVPAITKPEPQNQPSQLLDPWLEPSKVTNNILDYKNLTPTPILTPSHSEQPESQRQSTTQSDSMSKRGSGPFVAQSDNIPISVFESLPPETLPEIAEALHRAKRGQRSAVNTKSIPDFARAVTGTYATTTKKGFPAKRTVTAKGPIAAGVQGDSVKISKTRSANRKGTSAGKDVKTRQDQSEAHLFHEAEQMDVDEELDRDIPLRESQDSNLVAELDVPAQLTTMKVSGDASVVAELDVPVQLVTANVSDTSFATKAPTKELPAKRSKPEDSKTPSKTTKRQAKRIESGLTPQSATNNYTSRRRSPRLAEWEDAAAVTDEMNVDTPTPTKSGNTKKNNTEPKIPSRKSTRNATTSRQK